MLGALLGTGPLHEPGCGLAQGRRCRETDPHDLHGRRAPFARIRRTCKDGRGLFISAGPVGLDRERIGRE